MNRAPAIEVREVAVRLPVGAVILPGDGRVLRVCSCGEAHELVISGHPHPGAAHATATSRSRP